MFGLFRKKEDWTAALKEGAPLVDVRTPAEFAEGHLEGAENLPLQDLKGWATRFQAGETVVLVCRSGTRSGLAARALRGQGVKALNAGGWKSAQARLKS